MMSNITSDNKLTMFAEDKKNISFGWSCKTIWIVTYTFDIVPNLQRNLYTAHYVFKILSNLLNTKTVQEEKQGYYNYQMLQIRCQSPIRVRKYIYIMFCYVHLYSIFPLNQDTMSVVQFLNHPLPFPYHRPPGQDYLIVTIITITNNIFIKVTQRM